MTATTTRLLIPLLLAAAAPLGRAGDATTRAFNDEVQGVWDRLRPVGEAELRRQAQLQLGPLLREPKVEVDLTAIRSITLDLARGPGLTSFSDAGLALRVPAEGAWRVEVDGDVEVRFKLLGRWQKLKRSPFKPYPGPGQGDAHIESTGVDLVGPYWIGRYHGVSFP